MMNLLGRDKSQAVRLASCDTIWPPLKNGIGSTGCPQVLGWIASSTFQANDKLSHCTHPCHIYLLINGCMEWPHYRHTNR